MHHLSASSSSLDYIFISFFGGDMSCDEGETYSRLPL